MSQDLSGSLIMFSLVYFISIFGYIFGQEYYEERHKYLYRAQLPLNRIPSKFEVKGDNAVVEFSKYITSIQELARRDNLTVVYRVKVDVTTPHKRHMKKSLKHAISKKYNVPLKKQNMKLSNFEMSLRKRIGEKSQQQRVERDPTTQKQRVLLTTKPPSAGKYKPIIRSVRTNYTKIVRPVKNKVITLTK